MDLLHEAGGTRRAGAEPAASASKCASTSTSPPPASHAAGLRRRPPSSASTRRGPGRLRPAWRRRGGQAAVRGGGSRDVPRHRPGTGVADVPRDLERTGQVIYLQQFVRHPGWDLRAFVHRRPRPGRDAARRRRRLAHERRPGRPRPERVTLSVAGRTPRTAGRGGRRAARSRASICSRAGR